MGICSAWYIIFLAISIVLYYAMPNWRYAREIIIFISSAVFYLSYGRIAIIYPIAVIGVAYLIGILIEKIRRKELVFLFCLVDLGILIALKYIFNGAGSDLISDSSVWEKYLLVPLGISYYSLSLIGYIVDVYRGKYSAEKNIFHFSLFVFFFPHILQGPIARYDDLAPQLKGGGKQFDYDSFCYSVQLMLWGYIKKLIIADTAAVFVNNVYSYSDIRGGTELFIASILYTIEIYADFSGCVDIMRGTAGLYGINLMENFNQPYLSYTLNEFWRRWHISLSSWFRDYLYIPLGGNRKGELRRYINVLIVFLVSGIWHGTTINFLLWGAIHGCYQVMEDFTYKKVLRKRPREIDGRYKWIQLVITFMIVNFAWIFFRIPQMKDALKIVYNIIAHPSLEVFSNGRLFEYGIDGMGWIVFILFVALLLMVEIMNKNGIKIRDVIARQPIVVRWCIYLLGFTAVLLLGKYGTDYNANDFIYMRF